MQNVTHATRPRYRILFDSARVSHNAAFSRLLWHLDPVDDSIEAMHARGEDDRRYLAELEAARDAEDRREAERLGLMPVSGGAPDDADWDALAVEDAMMERYERGLCC